MPQVGMVINYNPPVGNPERAMFTTYVQRVCSSGTCRIVFNLWAGQAEGRSISTLEEHFGLCFSSVVDEEDIQYAVWKAYL